MANTNYGRKKNTTPHHIIPYTVGEDMIKIVQITNIQYGKLMKLYKVKGSFSKRLYQRLLLEFNRQNEREIIDVFTIDHNNHRSGTLVCLCNKEESMPPSSLLLNQKLDSVYTVNFATNPSDFELPKD